MAGWRLEHTYTQLPRLFYSDVSRMPVPERRVVVCRDPLAKRLGLDPETLNGHEGAGHFAGNTLPDGARPIAQAYAGPSSATSPPSGTGARSCLASKSPPPAIAGTSS